MQQVIRVIKAVPWALLCRLSFKALCLLGVALIAILVFAWKALVYAAKLFLTLLADDREVRGHVASATSIPDDAPSWVRHEIERDPTTTIYY